MTREEYLAQLRALLTGRTPPDELERILAYYTEYFDEAGPQGEGRVIRELGTPADRTYIRYTATTDWGWNGGNF